MNTCSFQTFTLRLALLLISSACFLGCDNKSSSPPKTTAFETDTTERSVARQWNEVLLDAIRNDYARPTVHARNLFHLSAAMYDAWSSYSHDATPYMLGQQYGSADCTGDFQLYLQPSTGAPQASIEAAISFAAYRLIRHRFSQSPHAEETMAQARLLMQSLGYDPDYSNANLSTGLGADLGNFIAHCYIEFGLQDGANEENGYQNQTYEPVNPPLSPQLPGNPDIIDTNRWQPLALTTFIDQSGNPITGGALEFLGPEWGNVQPFALTDNELTVFNRDGNTYKVYYDPGPPPALGSQTAAFYQWGFNLVAIWSSHLDPNDEVLWDISPASIGNIGNLPSHFEDYPNFYALEGGDASMGHPQNPVTGQPYTPQLVPRGDYARVLAEFWADGPNSETPPGHWFVILNAVTDHPYLERKFGGTGSELPQLEWDVKAYFVLGGAMHDAAITAWSIKGWYDYVRPVSALRAMAELGQSSDPNAPFWHRDGIPLEPDYIELVQPGDPLAGYDNQFAGHIKVRAWQGPEYVVNPQTDTGDVGWILMDNWWPYQRPSFVTPPFAGYISGHSTYSRAAAEALTLLTGNEFFPGGKSEFKIKANDFLVFEQGPSVDMTLEWATYRDASDQCSLSRIWGGIHPPADDIPGRIIGAQIGIKAFEKAEGFFN